MCDGKVDSLFSKEIHLDGSCKKRRRWEWMIGWFWGVEGDLQVFPMNRLKGKVTFNHWTVLNPLFFSLIDRRFGGLWWTLFCSRRIAGREKLWTKGWWGIILLLLHLIAIIVTGQWFMYVFCRVTVDRSGFSLAKGIHQFQSLGWSSKRLLLLAAAVFPIGDNWFDQPCQPCGFYCSPRREIMIYMICRVPLLSLGPYIRPMIPVYDLKTLVRWM